MKFPADRTMLTLGALDNAADGKFTPQGRQFVRVEDAGDKLLWEILPAELDELERQGWVDLLPPAPEDPDDMAKVQVTEKGRYALTRWVQQNHRRVRQLVRDLAPTRPPEPASILVTSVAS